MRTLTPAGILPPVVYITGLALGHLGRDTCHPRHVRVMSLERQGELQTGSSQILYSKKEDKDEKDT